MKIHLDMTGKALGKADFATLRAGLAAAQATTRTAAASDQVRPPLDLTEALTLLFGDRVPGGRDAAALYGSFHPVPMRDDIDDETKR